jgi:hypothetical protein
MRIQYRRKASCVVGRASSECEWRRWVYLSAVLLLVLTFPLVDEPSVVPGNLCCCSANDQRRTTNDGPDRWQNSPKSGKIDVSQINF